MNRVHPLLDKYDVKCDYDNIFGVKGTRWLKSLKLSDNDQILLHEYVMQIEFLNTEIKNIESKITCEASENESGSTFAGTKSFSNSGMTEDREQQTTSGFFKSTFTG